MMSMTSFNVEKCRRLASTN